MLYRCIGVAIAATVSCSCVARNSPALKVPDVSLDQSGLFTSTDAFSLVDYAKKACTSSTLIRFGRTAATVLSVAFDYKATLWKHDNKTSDGYKEDQHMCHVRSAKKLFDLCCTNGGIFIKVGQHLGSLDFLLPPEYVDTLKVLHSSAPQSPLENVMHVVREELGKKVLESIKTFDSKPLGAASLAQVHKVVLSDGRILALKVQHKEVKNHATEDTLTMEMLVNFVSWLFPEFKFDWLIEETKRNLPRELNFLHEGKNCEKIGRILHKFPYLKVPEIYWDLSTEKVLAMEFCDGGQVDDVNYMKEHGISSNEVSVKLGELYSEMIFKQGFIHCDPHPGNILVRQQPSNSSHAEIVLLDHGLYQTLTDDFRIKYCKLWQSLLEADIDAIKANCTALNVGEMYGLLACILSGRSWESVTGGIKHIPMSQKEAKEIQTEAIKYVPEITTLLSHVPREMILILKTNDLLRGIDSKLKTSDVSNSFVTMSKCCISAIFQNDIAASRTLFDCIKVYKAALNDMILVYLYQLSRSSLALSMRRWFAAMYNHTLSFAI